MKRGRTNSPSDDDTMRPEYDFSGGKRGVTARRYEEGANVVAISPDVLDVFPDGVVVNEALRALAPILRRRRDVHRTPRGRGNEPSGKEIAYRDFWGAFLPMFHERYPGWSRARADAPRKGHWIGFPSRRAGIYYAVTFQAKRFRVELDIYAAGDSGEATRRFKAIKERRDEIEASFGEPLEWEYQQGRKENRIMSYYGDEVNVEDRERWAELCAWSIERVGALRQAFQPHLDDLA